jgi:cyclophilin family peptidyl-prolyl cis-trans isomerase
MNKLLLSLLIFLALCGMAQAGTLVEMKTSAGVIKLELADEQAPITVKNFLAYVDQQFYDGTVFHRVMDGFMIQGGGFDQSPTRKQTKEPIKNEADNGLKNDKGTIAMARTGVVDSATSQFFINLVDNDFLNFRGRTPKTFGYAVFGRVVAGMEVVEAIGHSKTTVKNGLPNYPQPPVVIESIRRVEK